MEKKKKTKKCTNKKKIKERVAKNKKKLQKWVFLFLFYLPSWKSLMFARMDIVNIYFLVVFLDAYIFIVQKRKIIKAISRNNSPYLVIHMQICDRDAHITHRYTHIKFLYMNSQNLLGCLSSYINISASMSLFCSKG